MNNQSTRDLSHYARGNKDGLMLAKSLLQFFPLSEVVSKIQEAIDGYEDTEIRLSVEMSKTSEPPVSEL